MTSINYNGEIYPWHYYLAACATQARIALMHLDRIWAMEGNPPDVSVWDKRSTSDDIEVWAELQGFVTAAVIVSRFLKPNPVPPRGFPDKKKVRTYGHDRGVHLCKLLQIDDESPLLSIAEVRNGIEHVDERMDQIVVEGDVWSLSDWYISTDLYVQSRTSAEVVAEGTRGRHVNMRLFAPKPGILLFDGNTIDLFDAEVALHGLLVRMPAAHYYVTKKAPSGRLGFGSSAPRRWGDSWIERRTALERVRADIRDDGRSRLRLRFAPGTVEMALRPENAPDGTRACD
jgi:hypothetical protein